MSAPALYLQINNYVKMRLTPLERNGVPNNDHNYERIHQTKFNVVEKGDNVIAFMNGPRTVLVINGDSDANDYDNKTVAQILTDANTFIEALTESYS